MLDLTIIIPTKDRHVFLRRLLCSIYTEKLSIDVIIIDDASEKKIASVNKELSEEFGCRYFYNDKPKGAPFSRNFGASNANTKFIWFIDDDDYLQKGSLKIIEQYLMKDSNHRLYLTSMMVMSNNQEVQHIIPNEKNSSLEYFRRYGHLVNTSCAIIDREIFIMNSGWDERLLTGQDTDLFLHIASNNTIVCIERAVVCVDVGHPKRLGNHVYKQQIGKIQFLRKNWSLLHWKRRLYYIVTFVFFVPLLRQQTLYKEIFKKR